MTALPALVPAPAERTTGVGSFTLSTGVGVAGPPAWTAVVRRLLGPGTGLALPDRADGQIQLVADEELPSEGYRLRITPEAVEIAARAVQGLRWAVQRAEERRGGNGRGR